MSLTGTILFAHGSKDPLWAKPVVQIKQEILAVQPQWPVLIAFLEMSQPTLGEAAIQLMGMGVTDIVVLPVFLGVGKHLREDLPLLVSAIQHNYPNVTIRVLPAIGENPLFSKWVAQLALRDAHTETAGT